MPARVIERARIIQMAANGMQSQKIAKELGVSRPTVQLWRQRFLGLRLTGLEKDAPRPGRLPKIPDRKVRRIVELTLHGKPPNATHWSTRLMAKAEGVSEATVRRILRQHQLKPHLTKTFILSRGKQFVEKLYDVVGLYLNTPDRSLVLCVDEKSQIQALDRTQPGLPLKKGRCGTMTHDYKRNGTTTLFAAMVTLDGRVIGDCMPRHRHQEFIRFLKTIDLETPPGMDLHLIVPISPNVGSNPAADKSPARSAGLCPKGPFQGILDPGHNLPVADCSTIGLPSKPPPISKAGCSLFYRLCGDL
jgi:transposase